MSKSNRIVLLGLVGGLSLASSARGATLHVPSEYATIQAAVDAAMSGDTVLVAPGTYSDFEARPGPAGTFSTAIVFLKGGVTVTSELGPEVTILDMVEATDVPRVISAWNMPEEAKVSGFTITTPLEAIRGAMLRTSETVTFANCIFRDIGMGNTNETGIQCRDTDVVVLGCRFQDLDGRPGGIAISDGSLVIEDSWFENCQGGAISVNGVDRLRSPTATIRNSVFLNNFKDAGSGGAVYAQTQDVVEIESCRFEGNVSANSAGGAVRIALGTRPWDVGMVRDCVFVRNESSSTGGAMKASGPSLQISGNTFFECTQDHPHEGGAAVQLLGGGTLFQNNIIAHCTGAEAVNATPGGIESNCNVFWGNTDGDVVGFEMGPQDMVADPLFCDPVTGDFRVHSSSPCLPENSNGCGLIGAFGEGCGPISLTPESWSQIKAYHRSEREGRTDESD